ncbi:DegT/DnrJ/EryC1/StrS family aminotransferase [Streptomyces kunmingensis]|uniref:DegT/DnrJ/EryC1/StrS family aminotransferase n=1 Tax=Streptomyces kunmingensis TaxID=68225 RepID=A0ABU6CCU1_9ACTN|nr:DegT/DnrJ/EryC1/StrS family aminotransferase [Streptomyces kunmingensis]MEB3961700.1 DegT/DnrJ/EryC1/StrS family aminotransferase [Streptomyces kunmingensis]
MLQAAGVGAGDEVIVPAYGNPEVAEAVVHAGAAPVFADIDADTYCIDPAHVTDLVNTRTAAVIAVHRFGHRADIARLHDLGNRHGLLVLEQGESEKPYAEVAQRRAHAAYLSARLNGVRTPDGHEAHTYQQYVVRVPGNGRPDRDAFARVLRGKGVECSVPVKTPVHRLPAFRRDVVLPETERAADETLALPVDGTMSRKQLQRVVSACNALGGLLQPAF